MDICAATYPAHHEGGQPMCCTLPYDHAGSHEDHREDDCANDTLAWAP